MVAVPGATAVTVAVEIPFFSFLEFAFMKKTVSLKRFLKAPFINMPHIFGNMVYLNIKERDRFF